MGIKGDTFLSYLSRCTHYCIYKYKCTHIYIYNTAVQHGSINWMNNEALRRADINFMASDERDRAGRKMGCWAQQTEGALQ